MAEELGDEPGPDLVGPLAAEDREDVLVEVAPVVHFGRRRQPRPRRREEGWGRWRRPGLESERAFERHRLALGLGSPCELLALSGHRVEPGVDDDPPARSPLLDNAECLRQAEEGQQGELGDEHQHHDQDADGRPRAPVPDGIPRHGRSMPDPRPVLGAAACSCSSTGPARGRGRRRATGSDLPGSRSGQPCSETGAAQRTAGSDLPRLDHVCCSSSAWDRSRLGGRPARVAGLKLRSGQYSGAHVGDAAPAGPAAMRPTARAVAAPAAMPTRRRRALQFVDMISSFWLGPTGGVGARIATTEWSAIRFTSTRGAAIEDPRAPSTAR